MKVATKVGLVLEQPGNLLLDLVLVELVGLVVVAGKDVKELLVGVGVTALLYFLNVFEGRADGRFDAMIHG